MPHSKEVHNFARSKTKKIIDKKEQMVSSFTPLIEEKQEAAPKHRKYTNYHRNNKKHSQPL